jgi:uncharacterized protein YbjT (DUF2867 family)
MATVLVLGSTGRFGGIAAALLQRGHSVRAATRDPRSPAAGDLRRHGADVVTADLEDLDSLRTAARSADVVFAGGTAHAAGPAADVRHGANVVRAARDADVAHLVYVSVAGADRASDVPVFESKRAVEAQIGDLGIPATVVAPVYFMENLWNPWNLPALDAGRLPTPVGSARALQQVAIADVVAFSALVIEHRGEFLDRRIAIASDELTAQDAAAALDRLLGAPVDIEEPPAATANPLFRWLDRVGDHVDIDDLRARFPEVGWHRFAEWAAQQNLSRLRAGASR